jgi:hypothetical protein
MRRFTIAFAAALTLAACAPRDKTAADTSAQAAAAATPAVPADVEKALAVKRGIEAAPNKADSVLTANGLTPAGFDSLMYRIAGDSALRAAYAAANR